MYEKNEELEIRFSYHAPSADQIEKYGLLRETAKEFAYLIHSIVPDGREKAKALAKLEEAVMDANAGIARRS